MLGQSIHRFPGDPTFFVPSCHCTAYPTFSRCTPIWLVPRLSEFQRTYPEIDLRLQTSNDVVDLQARTVDLAIRYGRGSYPGLAVRKLMSDVFVPVCSPRLLQGEHPLKEPGNLVHHPLLHFEWIHYGPEAPNWKNWLELAGMNSIDPMRGAKFNEESLAIQAAIAGQGVALCSSIHVADDVALGFLVKPFEVALEGLNYSAMYLKNHPKEESILRFVDWLVGIASTFSHRGVVISYCLLLWSQFQR